MVSTLSAVVVNEYGGLAGVVSMEDVVETLLGIEIMDEVDAMLETEVIETEKYTLWI